MTSGTDRLSIRIRIHCGDEIAMGPGKADLLEAIGREGSISAGARALGMSYRRAWLLVDAMNRCWDRPLIETAIGGGARLTEAGRDVLHRYRALQQALDRACDGEDRDDLFASLRERPLTRRETP